MKRKIWVLFLMLSLCSEKTLFSQEQSSSSAEVEGLSPSAQGEIKGFTFVIPDKKGGKQSIVRGDTANFLPNGTIDIINVKTQIFRKNESDIFITTSKANFNKATREVTTNQDVEILSQEMLIQGKGLYWNPHVGKATIYENVSVKVFSGMSQEGI